MSKKVVIIGGGIAGLSAGIYAAMNNFETEIVEMSSIAGGQCTAWDRKKYRFDYCLHWLVGTSSGAFNHIWKETNVLNDKTEVINHEIHSQITDEQGNTFTIYSDINRWEKYLLELAPEDEIPIKQMCNEMRKSGNLEPFALPPELRSPLDYIKILPKMLPLMNVVRKYGRITCEEYFAKLNFKSDRIKTVLNTLYGGRNMSALVFIFMLGWFHQKNAGYIKGGSFPLAQRMVEKYKKLGGKLTYNARVEKIIVENNTANGVVLTDGKTIYADYVISAADGYTTIYKMLNGEFVSKEIDFAYKNWELFTPIVQVSFGIKKEFISDCPVKIHTSKNQKIGSTLLENGFSIMNYCYDTTMAPKGKTTVVLRYDSPWKIWQNMDEKTYKTEKIAILKDATDCLQKEYPGVADYIEVTDVATPLTDVRYTGVLNGAYEGFLPTKDNMMKNLDMQLPKLKNFYMAGQWLFPGGGLPPAAQTGKWTVQLICKKEKQKFNVS